MERGEVEANRPLTMFFFFSSFFSEQTGVVLVRKKVALFVAGMSRGWLMSMRVLELERWLRGEVMSSDHF